MFYTVPENQQTQVLDLAHWVPRLDVWTGVHVTTHQAGHLPFTLCKEVVQIIIMLHAFSCTGLVWGTRRQ